MVDLSISHYDTGTATVAAGGTAVTGQGTNWAGAVRPGDLFGTHRGLSIRILSVNSNTSLTLARAWPGPAQTAAAYEIQRTPYDVGYRQAIEDLVSGISDGNLPAFAALVGAADKLPYFDSNSSMALADLTDFARQLLAESSAASARSRLELLAVQSSAQDTTNNRLLRSGAFGLGAIGNAALLTNFHGANIPNGFHRWSGETGNSPNPFGGGAIKLDRGAGVTLWIASSVAGSLSNPVLFVKSTNGDGSSWSPWMPLVPESGSNGNGYYQRFADGTQKVWGRVDIPQSEIGGAGTFSFPFTYPASFVSNDPHGPSLTGSIGFSGPSSTFDNLVGWGVQRYHPTSNNTLFIRSSGAFNTAATFTYEVVGRYMP